MNSIFWDRFSDASLPQWSNMPTIFIAFYRKDLLLFFEITHTVEPQPAEYG